MFEYDVFLSFSSEDEEIVRPIWQELSLSGLRVFWSDETLKANAGQSFFKVIQQSLAKSQHLILICTNASLSSKWVQLEYETFFSNYHIKNEEQQRLILLPQSQFNVSSLPPFLKNLQIASTVKEIIPLVGGIDIQAIIREKENLARQLDVANIKISQLQTAATDKPKKSHNENALQEEITSLENALSDQKERNRELQNELTKTQESFTNLQKTNSSLSEELSRTKKPFSQSEKEGASFLSQNKRTMYFGLFGLFMANLLGMSLSRSNGSASDIIGLLFMVFFLFSIGIGIRYMIKKADVEQKNKG